MDLSKNIVIPAALALGVATLVWWGGVSYQRLNAMEATIKQERDDDKVTHRELQEQLRRQSDTVLVMQAQFSQVLAAIERLNAKMDDATVVVKTKTRKAVQP